MTNHSLQVEEIKDYLRRGMPEGGEPVIKSLPVLFRRIEELEHALVPFARQGLANNENKPLIYVYHKDCVTALNILSSKVAKQNLPPEAEYIPAE